MRQWIVGILVVVLIVSGLQWSSAPDALAQDGEACIQVAAQALADAQAACTGVGRGEACVGHAGVTAAGATLAASGDRAAMADLQSLATSAANPDTNEWGIALLQLSAGLPEGSAVTAVLFGEAQIARPAQVAGDQTTLMVSNGRGSEINLRNGAATTYDLVGQLASGEQATADGRNEQGDWVRVQFSGGIGWAFVPLIQWDGDQSAIDALPVLLPNDVTPPVAAGEPFQSFTLTTGDAACSAAPSGLLLQYRGEQPAQVQVNQVSLEFSDATLLISARANDNLTISVLDGSSQVIARGVPEQADEGEQVSVSLGGDDGLTPLEAPLGGGSYAFADVAYAPLSLLPGTLVCRVGLPSEAGRVVLRVGPGTQRGELGDMSARSMVAVSGWANDPDGAPWWQLDTGETPAWVAQADVRGLGDCAAVAEVEPPPLVFAPPTGAEGGVPAAGPDLAPTANSVWQMIPGSDNLTGTCSAAPAINFCDHLAAIGPIAGGISWRGMEPSPYPLTQVQPNVYSYSGPNIQGTGQITLILTFSSDTTLNMTMTLVLASEPDCQHVYYYSGTKNW
jgi:hypothetical protein